jgi:hypothetical protein
MGADHYLLQGIFWFPRLIALLWLFYGETLRCEVIAKNDQTPSQRWLLPVHPSVLEEKSHVPDCGES